jgi:hypothetical protein
VFLREGEAMPEVLPALKEEGFRISAREPSRGKASGFPLGDQILLTHTPGSG